MPGPKLSRKKSHRQSVIKNLTASLIVHERINTTQAKAKAAQRYFERLMTLIKKADAVTTRRALEQKLTVKEAVSKAVEVLKPRFAKVSSGYTRILKTQNRPGDFAPMCLLELTIKTEEEKPETKTETSRSKSETKPSDPKKKNKKL